jgi:7-cyano-7-deazaguanine synthase in queuosine biosynthesis
MTTPMPDPWHTTDRARTFMSLCTNVVEQSLWWHCTHSTDDPCMPEVMRILLPPAEKFPTSLRFDRLFWQLLRWQMQNSSMAAFDSSTELDLYVTSPNERPIFNHRIFVTAEVRPGLSARRRLVIMYGGGVDSTIAAYHAIKGLHYPFEQVCLVQVSYGAPYEKKEEIAFRELAPFFTNLGISCVNLALTPRIDHLDEKGMPKGYIIPFRNAMLAAIGAMYGETVWIVANYRKVDDEPGAAVDKNRRFYGLMSQVLSEVYREPRRVESPFLHMSKADTIRYFREMVGRKKAIEVLRKTTTCYHGEHHRCGTCYACAKFLLAVNDAGLATDFLDQFATDPLESPQFQEYLQRELNKGRQVPAQWVKRSSGAGGSK